MLTTQTINKTPNNNEEHNHHPAASASSSISMVLINDRKTYIPVTSCVINHIISVCGLTDSEKLFYLLATLYSKLNKSINSERSAEKSAKEWGQLLNRSEQHVFQMQKNLEQLGYFHIVREKDEDNQNEKNIITPTLPKNVFNELMNESNRIGSEHILFNDQETSRLSYLDDTKMFIKFNLPMFKMIIANHDLSSLQKLIWIYFFYRSYISYNNQNGDGTRQFITNYQEISAIVGCEECTVSVAINKLAKLGFISKRQFRLQNSAKKSRRKKKSCWEICALIPETQMKELLQQRDRQNLAPLTLDDFRLYGSSSITDTASSLQVQVNWPLNGQTSNQSLENKATIKNESAVSVTSLSTQTCNLSNSYSIEGGSYKNIQYYNKYNILNTKNIVTEISDETNIISGSNDFNVFIENKLIASTEELAFGLTVAARFEEKVFLKPQEEFENLEETIKQVDPTLTNEERWLVTKTAFTLHQKLQTEIQARSLNGANTNDVSVFKLKETLFTPIEERLVSLWESFSDLPHKAEQEEFLIRKSWVLKLLLQTKETINLGLNLKHPQSAMIPTKEIDLPFLPGDKSDKAQKFAKKLRTKGLAKGYAAEISTEDLAREFIYHAATWTPERLQCNTREDQIDAALSFAWKAAEQGTWKCPYKLLNAQIAQREAYAASWKN